MIRDMRWLERIVLWLAVLLVCGAVVWINLLQSHVDMLTARLALVAGESKSLGEWARRSDAENASLRYLRPLATKYAKERQAGKGKKESAAAAAESWK